MARPTKSSETKGEVQSAYTELTTHMSLPDDLGEPLKMVSLHNGVDVPGAFATSTTLNPAKIKGIELFANYKKQILYIKCKGSIAWTPFTNVKVAVDKHVDAASNA